MADWIEPIYNRTSADVTRAKLQVKEWIEAMARGESVDITDLKGFLNAVDLNRIENNVEYLDLVSNLQLSIKTDWSRTSLPNMTDIQRIIDNINKLIENFEFEDFTAEMPTTILTYSHANTVERNLTIIKNLLEDLSVRIQAVFSQFDAAVDMEVVVALTLPFNTELDKFIVQTNIKAVDSESIPIDTTLDNMTIMFSAKVIDSIVHPVKMSNSVCFGLSGVVQNSDSNPIITSPISTFADVHGKLNNSNSVHIKQDLGLSTMGLDSLLAILSPASISLVNDITTDFAAEALAHLLTTNEADFTTEVVAGGMGAKCSFADMFVESIFSIVSSDIEVKITNTYSQKINGDISTTVQTDMLLGLYSYAKVATYNESTIGDMDTFTLEELSYREL